VLAAGSGCAGGALDDITQRRLQPRRIGEPFADQAS
jgi:hypothetical protein